MGIPHEVVVSGLLAAARMRPRANDGVGEPSRPKVTGVRHRDAGEPPAEWRDGVSAVQAMQPPPGFPPERWRQVQQDTARLLAEHGAELHRLGWTAEDLWGVHPAASAVRCAGLAIVLGGGQVAEVTPEHVAFVRPSGARLTYVRRPSPEAVPLWGLER